MYSLLQRFFQNIFHRGQPALNGAADAAPANALGCRDLARIDFRLSADEKLYFIEANPLPGLAPDYSDYPMLAAFCGVGYDELVGGILYAALMRYNMEENDEC